MKKWVIIIVIVVVVALFFVVNNLGKKSTEKTSEAKTLTEPTPKEIKTEEEVIACALNLYKEAKDKGTVFVSQCLGNCGDYAVDIVDVPRNEIDNLVENQCKDYREGKVSHFIELDQQGNTVRIM